RVEDGFNGLHFKVGDAEYLADKIEYVFDNPESREKFISNIPHVKTIDENVSELIEIYKKHTKS
ncbi:MAG: glycosyl transferase family 1, partial [Candidatus Moranbacteria bacterium]|nr:glycosyl transferase family 1 [Candidatus Moranbacteria bacterium]